MSIEVEVEVEVEVEGGSSIGCVPLDSWGRERVGSTVHHVVG
jgi:hypothetical protein